mgnify:CR=1 FL=1
MAPTPPHTPPRAIGATGSRRRTSTRTRPPQRPRWLKGFTAGAARRWAHPIALVLAACCAVSLTLLTACAKDASPVEVTGTLPTRFFSTPNASADATPTASALPSLSPELQAQRATALAEPKPSKPEAVSQNTEEGAINAVNYFFALYRYAFITGDTADLAAMSEDACVFCKSTIDNATKLHDGGGWANPWETNLNDLYYIPPGEEKEYSGIQGTITSSASTTVRGSGETTEKSAETLSFFVALKYADEAWTIKGVSVE